MIGIRGTSFHIKGLDDWWEYAIFYSVREKKVDRGVIYYTVQGTNYKGGGCRKEMRVFYFTVPSDAFLDPDNWQLIPLIS